MNGWVGKILRVDLTKGEIETIPTNKFVPKYLGGRGLAARIYWEEIDPEVKALSPENKLIFTTGPLGGTLAPTSGRTSLVSKAPAAYPREVYWRSNAGGHWGPELKYAGYDGLIVQGKATKPVYISIMDDNVEIKDAGHLWGKGTRETQNLLKTDLHAPEVQTACIGPAGENLCKVSIILTGDSNAWGHGGLGAVMGSKNLKAIAVRGTGGVKVADPQKLMEVCHKIQRLVTRKEGETAPPAPHRKQRYMAWPTRYNPQGAPLESEAAAQRGNAKLGMGACNACPVACAVTVAYADDPEMFGSFRCVDAIGYLESETEYYKGPTTFGKVPFEVAKLCDHYGIDNYEFSDFLGWFVESIKAGIFTEENTDLPLSDYGSIEFWRELLDKVAKKEGIGELLSEGGPHILKKFIDETDSEKLKETAEQAIIDATGETGARNLSPYHMFEPVLFHLGPVLMPGMEDYENAKRKLGKEMFGLDTFDGQAWSPAVTRWSMNESILMNCLLYCDWSGPWLYTLYTPDYLGDSSLPAQLYSAVTGVESSQQELHDTTCERICALERSIQIREGRSSIDDSLQDEMFQRFEWIDRKEFKKEMDAYYKIRGWNEAGAPISDKLVALDLEDVADDLKNRGYLK
jgi:aldehyde:ferredoxin oxidoreductase